MNLESKTRTIRLSKREREIIDSVPDKKGISVNHFINECIEAHNIPTSRKLKVLHAERVIFLTNLSLLEQSTACRELPETVKKAILKMDGGLIDNGMLTSKKQEKIVFMNMDLQILK